MINRNITSVAFPLLSEEMKNLVSLIIFLPVLLQIMFIQHLLEKTVEKRIKKNALKDIERLES